LHQFCDTSAFTIELAPESVCFHNGSVIGTMRSAQLYQYRPLPYQYSIFCRKQKIITEKE
ncbi:MAG: hypothetical protein IIW43_02075, partial [Selenomonadales bacterium]|nr:hypothetical protein [Selenomonadales bacterium]